MAKTQVLTVPEAKEVKETTVWFEKLLEDRNKTVAKWFSMEPLDVTLKLMFSRSSLVALLDPNGDSMGVFAGYPDHSDNILISHPASVEGLFRDTNKQMSILLDYCLVKFYICQKYYPQRSDFKMYYKPVAQVLSEICSGVFKPDITKFDIKIFLEEKRFTKEQELGMVLYIMSEKSGIDFIFEHLDTIMEDKDIKKTVFKIYKKSFNELVSQVQKELIKVDKKLKLAKGR